MHKGTLFKTDSSENDSDDEIEKCVLTGKRPFLRLFCFSVDFIAYLEVQYG